MAYETVAKHERSKCLAALVIVRHPGLLVWLSGAGKDNWSGLFSSVLINRPLGLLVSLSGPGKDN